MRRRPSGWTAIHGTSHPESLSRRPAKLASSSRLTSPVPGRRRPAGRRRLRGARGRRGAAGRHCRRTAAPAHRRRPPRGGDERCTPARPRARATPRPRRWCAPSGAELQLLLGAPGRGSEPTGPRQVQPVSPRVQPVRALHDDALVGGEPLGLRGSLGGVAPGPLARDDPPGEVGVDEHPGHRQARRTAGEGALLHRPLVTVAQPKPRAHGPILSAPRANVHQPAGGTDAARVESIGPHPFGGRLRPRSSLGNKVATMRTVPDPSFRVGPRDSRTAGCWRGRDSRCSSPPGHRCRSGRPVCPPEPECHHDAVHPARTSSSGATLHRPRTRSTAPPTPTRRWSPPSCGA